MRLKRNKIFLLTLVCSISIILSATSSMGITVEKNQFEEINNIIEETNNIIKETSTETFNLGKIYVTSYSHVLIYPKEDIILDPILNKGINAIINVDYEISCKDGALDWFDVGMVGISYWDDEQAIDSAISEGKQSGTLSFTIYNIQPGQTYEIKLAGKYIWVVDIAGGTDEMERAEKVTIKMQQTEVAKEFAVYGDYPHYWSDGKLSLRAHIDVCNKGSRYSLLDWSIISKKEVGDPNKNNKIYGVGINVDKTSGDDLKNEEHYGEKHEISFELTNLSYIKIRLGIHSVVKIEIIFQNDNYPSITQTATIEIYVYHGSKALTFDNILRSKFPLIDSLLSKMPNSAGLLVKQDTFEATIKLYGIHPTLGIPYKINPSDSWVKIKQLSPQEKDWEELNCEQNTPSTELIFKTSLETGVYTIEASGGSDFKDSKIDNVHISPNYPEVPIILGKKTRSMNYCNLQISELLPSLSNLLKILHI